MGQALHVVGKVAGEIDDGCAETGFSTDAALAELRFDERGKDVGRNLLKSHDRPCLVEGTPRADHLLHQAGLGARKDVTDLSLLLRCRSQCVLDAAAVERLDRLELVERNDDGALLFRSELLIRLALQISG